MLHVTSRIFLLGKHNDSDELVDIYENLINFWLHLLNEGIEPKFQLKIDIYKSCFDYENKQSTTILLLNFIQYFLSNLTNYCDSCLRIFKIEQTALISSYLLSVFNYRTEKRVKIAKLDESLLKPVHSCLF
jgi:hypothetical protein